MMQAKIWHPHYDAHVPKALIYPHITLIDLLNNSASKFPEKSCCLYQGIDYSYHTINSITTHLAKILIHLGLNVGDRVGVLFPNSPSFIMAYFATLKAGGIVVAINPRYTGYEIEEMVKTSQLKWFICLRELKNVIDPITTKYKIRAVVFADLLNHIELFPSNRPRKEYGELRKDLGIYELSDLMNSKIPDNVLPDVNFNSPAIFQYTGGTTGTPKAAIGLHRNLVANTQQFIAWCDLHVGQETILTAIPLYHVYGMVLTMCLGIALGARLLLISDPRDIGEILSQIQKYRPTFFPGVPNMYYAITQHPDVREGGISLDSIKACISGSSPLHAEVKHQFEALTGGRLMEGYGLSEAPTSTHCNPLYGANKTGSIGLPLPDVDCRIVDLESGAHDVDIGEVGELIIKGPQVMKGYYQMPDEDKITLRADWLYTGDVARMDEEGYFYLIDRKKSLIKVGGLQVWPNEVEKIICEHPTVADAGVGGVPDMTRGEKVIAWVMLKANQITNQDEIQKWCKKKLVSYKIPAEIIIVDQLPRTSVGKILKRKLISEYQQKKEPDD